MRIVKVYEQVRDYIEQEARRQNPGDILPSEVQYAMMLSVSRPTVRKAVQELIDIGLIRRVPGKGLMVGDGSVGIRGKILIGLPFAMGDGFYFKIVMSCIDRANQLGYAYKIINTLDPAERLRLISEEPVEDYLAFVLSVYDSPYDKQLIQKLLSRKAKILLVDNQPDEFDLPIVACNDFAGGYMAGNYLIGKNHRNIMYITSTRNVQTVRDRLKGFMQAFADQNMDTSGIYIHAVDDIGNPQLSYFFDSTFDSSILKEKGITALFGYSSLPIISLCNTLVRKGYHIPEDLSVIGYGDYSIISAANMLITNIETPAEEMGRAIVENIEESYLNRKPLESKILQVTLDRRHTVLRLSDKEGA